MNFQKITSLTSCECLNNLQEDNESIFIRRVGDSKVPKNGDFKADSDKKDFILNNDLSCKEACEKFGVSIEIWSEESQKKIIDRSITTLSIGQKLKKQICKFKLEKDAGLVKHTPEQENEHNPFHYDLFKEDNFDISKINVLEMIPIKL
jgi:hypothetical protein